MNNYKTLQELFNDPSRWTKFAYARNADGLQTQPNEPDAVCWCLTGGISLVYWPSQQPFMYEALSNRIRNDDLGCCAAEYNDNPQTTIEDIQKLVKLLDI